MSTINIHDEWLSLLDISGTFLAPPVLKEVYPQGLDALDGLKRKRLRQTYDEWSDSYLVDEKEFPKIHEAWIKEVLLNCLDYGHSGGQFLKSGQDIPASLHCPIAEYGVTLSPEYALIDSQREKPTLLLIQSYPRDVDLNKLMKHEHYSATPVEQMVQLCRASQFRLGLVTNGEHWILIDAPVGSMSTSAGWQARLWIQESISLQSFVHLLGISRFFVSTDEQLPVLIDRSLQYQDEVTSALGTQIQRAIEVLIQSLDKYDLESGRTLLEGVTEPELYEAALTVMMRLVFLLSAEERGLLLLDEGAYQKNYALSTLRMQLREEDDEILERRWDAWSRLLALFRMVYGGVEHESFRLPALGGSLFDPDQFTFLEGRAKGTSWRIDEAKPLPIDNRTVLLLLEAIQQFEGRTLSYRSLDVEQIGYVYEGLLERTVKRTSEVILDVGATRNAEKPLVSLNELESIRQSGITTLELFFVERSGSSISRIRNDLAKPVDERLSEKLLTACAGDPVLRDQIKPYANLLRNDSWGYPLVYPAGSYVITTGSDRRETGSHYTPKPLTEAIVTLTLTPIVYVGPAEGLPRENWKLKPPEEILDLKICDPAMGSGAFLVQVCRWLSDRLIDSWAISEAEGLVITSEGQKKKSIDYSELMPMDLEARIVIARRLIAERCLYGVDLNPLAVELAKLSIWLITFSKGRPFGFLDHNLKYGDSLLGLQNLEQLINLSMNPAERSQQGLFVRSIRASVDQAIELRKNLRAQPIRNIHDIELMSQLNVEACEKLYFPILVADAFIGSVLKASGNAANIRAISDEINVRAGKAFQGDSLEGAELNKIGRAGLSIDLMAGKSLRKPFHWPLEFPEVFQSNKSGFDAIIGNPPFLGGRKISSVLGPGYEKYLKYKFSAKGAGDLCCYFFRKAFDLLGSEQAAMGFIATNSIREGDSPSIGLEPLIEKSGVLYSAESSFPWPGKAGVFISMIHVFRGAYDGFRYLNGKNVINISCKLLDEQDTKLYKLKNKLCRCSAGKQLYGKGFILEAKEVERFIANNPNNSQVIKPYFNAEIFNDSYDLSSPLSAIDFDEMDEVEAKKFIAPFKHLEDTVKPIRSQITGQVHEECFWLYWDKRASFFKGANKIGKVLVCGRHTAHLAFQFLPSSYVLSEALQLFCTDKYSHFGLLQSSIHEMWVRKYSSTIGEGLRYSTSDVFDTFPAPADLEVIASIGEDYYRYRRDIQLKLNLGLTSLYNNFHDPNNSDNTIMLLRDKHEKLDSSVLLAYGWNDIVLNYGFHDGDQGISYSMDNQAKQLILKNLLRLNNKEFQLENLIKTYKASKIEDNLNVGNKVSSQKGFDFGGS